MDGLRRARQLTPPAARAGTGERAHPAGREGRAGEGGPAGGEVCGRGRRARQAAGARRRAAHREGNARGARPVRCAVRGMHFSALRAACGCVPARRGRVLGGRNLPERHPTLTYTLKPFCGMCKDRSGLAIRAPPRFAVMVAACMLRYSVRVALRRSSSLLPRRRPSRPSLPPSSCLRVRPLARAGAVRRCSPSYSSGRAATSGSG
jgi:hypothetical protein